MQRSRAAPGADARSRGELICRTCHQARARWAWRPCQWAEWRCGTQECPPVRGFTQCKVCDGTHHPKHGGPKQGVPASSQQRATRLPPPYEPPGLEGDVTAQVTELWDFLRAFGCAPVANYEEEQRPDGVESAAAPSQAHAAPAQPWAPTSSPPLPQSSLQPATVQPRASRASASTEGGGGEAASSSWPSRGHDTADSARKRETCTQRCTVQMLDGGMCEGRCARETGHVDRGDNGSFDGGHFCLACWEKGEPDPRVEPVTKP